MRKNFYHNKIVTLGGATTTNNKTGLGSDTMEEMTEDYKG